MAGYITADTIRALREGRGLTQRALAELVGVTDKAVSRWETGRGLPDVALAQPLARALGVSLAELLTGEVRTNANRAGNMLRSAFHVCPLCGNVVHALGEASISCCGCSLPPQRVTDAEEPDDAHALRIERVEDEWLVSLDHPMEKGHFISFVALVTTDTVHLKKLYPEQAPRARIPGGNGWVLAYCNRHGLFRARTPRPVR